jgi:alpha-tubulin suppressor-like RCC1 family protein
VAEGGAAYCWGYTLFAGSASGEVAASRVPGGPWREIATGFSHACALTTDGVAYCWGGGANGQLGTGRVESSLGEPTRVATSLRFAHLAAGSAHTCALTTDGAVYCWGDNGGGQLGAASGADCRTASSRPVPLPCALAPQPVESAVRFASIAAGGSATCALTAAGVTWCWGATLVVRAVRTGPGPLRVEGAPAFVSLALGPSHGCGLTADGAAYCWGTNTSGELGLGYASPPGDAIGVLEPTPVVGGHRFRALAAADVATCGIDASGELYCWGNDVFGTLGAGRTSAERCINGVPCSTSPMWAALPTSPGGGAAGRG